MLHTYAEQFLLQMPTFSAFFRFHLHIHNLPRLSAHGKFTSTWSFAYSLSLILLLLSFHFNSLMYSVWFSSCFYFVDDELTLLNIILPHLLCSKVSCFFRCAKCRFDGEKKYMIFSSKNFKLFVCVCKEKKIKIQKMRIYSITSCSTFYLMRIP